MKIPATAHLLLLGLFIWPATLVQAIPAELSPPPDDAEPQAPANPPPSGALRRCIGPDGLLIFTDRRCEDVQGVESAGPPPAALPGSPGVVIARTCARNQDDLLFGVRSALENRDVNRFADFYHWTGIGTAEGYRLMERLESFSARPLVDVRLVSSVEEQSEQRFRYDSPFDDRSDDPYVDDRGLDEPDADDTYVDQFGELRPENTRPKRAADLLRVDQMRSLEDAAAQVTFFHLRSNAGCWWLQF